MSAPTSRKAPRVLFAGGGSGGHLYPAVAVADQLTAIDRAECLFACSGRTIDRRILEHTRYRYQPIEGPRSDELARAPWQSCRSFFRGYRQADRWLKTDGPDVVVGCGGYVSLPTVIAAKLRRIPIVLMEQNAIAGWATTLLAPLAQAICTPFEEVASLAAFSKKCLVTGTPIRQQIVELGERSLTELLRQRIILVMGGSHGSSVINRVIVEALTQRGVPLGWQLLHLTGSEQQQQLQQSYARVGLDVDVRAYADNIAPLLANSGLAVCRAGGSTLAELAVAGIPGLIVPIAGSARQHQQANAAWYAQAGAVRLFDEADPLMFQALADTIHELAGDQPLREKMIQSCRTVARPLAAKETAELLRRFF